MKWGPHNALTRPMGFLLSCPDMSQAPIIFALNRPGSLDFTLSDHFLLILIFPLSKEDLSLRKLENITEILKGTWAYFKD